MTPRLHFGERAGVSFSAINNLNCRYARQQPKLSLTMPERKDKHPRRDADAELARLFHQFLERGDETSLAQLIDKSAPSVFGIARDITHDHGLAQDVTQEVFHHFVRSNQAIKKPEAVGYWLRRTAFRVAWRHRNKKTKALGMVTNPETLYAPDDGSQSPLDLLLNKEFQEHFKSAIAGLSFRQRQCVELRRQGVEPKDAATMLGISPEAFYSNLSRAIQHLRRALEEFL